MPSTITTATTMLEFDFMRNALAASGLVGAVAGMVGYVLVLRGQTFAGHALSHVGFAGATGAVLVGLSPLWGMTGFTVAVGVAMAFLGERLSSRDVSIGVVLSLSLGFGLLFLNLHTHAATQATALLFGNVLGVDEATLWILGLLAVVVLGGLGVIARPLLFASLQPELAEAKGVPLRAVGVAFLVLVALTVAQAAQIVGVLLVFALMVGPPAAAARLTHRVGAGILLAAVLAVAESWAGLVLAYHTDWPTSFWIAMLSGAVYFASLLKGR